MASKLEALRAKLIIDEYHLELMLKQHPELVYDVGIELAFAISNRDQAKQNLEEIEAVVDNEIRQNAIDKVTEKDVESQKRRDKKVIAHNEDFLALKHLAAQWGVLKEAFDQRSYAISKLVDLYLANYYSNIEKNGETEFKTVQADRIKTHNREQRRVRVAP